MSIKSPMNRQKLNPSVKVLESSFILYLLMARQMLTLTKLIEICLERKYVLRNCFVLRKFTKSSEEKQTRT